MFEYSSAPPTGFSRVFQSRRFRVVAAITVAWVVLVLVVAAVASTPYLAIWRMRTAAVNRDAETFCSYIDFPVLRENLKAELNAKMLFEMQNDRSLKDNPFAGLAAMAGPAMINNMIDGYVTPAAIERGFMNEAVPKDKNVASQTLNPDFLNEEKGSVSTGYDGLNEFWVIFRSKDGKNSSLIFQRRMLLSWQLINIKFD